MLQSLANVQRIENTAGKTTLAMRLRQLGWVWINQVSCMPRLQRYASKYYDPGLKCTEMKSQCQ